jgi:hypothetical protein
MACFALSDPKWPLVGRRMVEFSFIWLILPESRKQKVKSRNPEAEDRMPKRQNAEMLKL